MVIDDKIDENFRSKKDAVGVCLQKKEFIV